MFRHPISTSGVTVRLKVKTAMLKNNKQAQNLQVQQWRPMKDHIILDDLVYV